MTSLQCPSHSRSRAVRVLRYPVPGKTLGPFGISRLETQQFNRAGKLHWQKQKDINIWCSSSNICELTTRRIRTNTEQKSKMENTVFKFSINQSLGERGFLVGNLKKKERKIVSAMPRQYHVLNPIWRLMGLRC